MLRQVLLNRAIGSRPTFGSLHYFFAGRDLGADATYTSNVRIRWKHSSSVGPTNGWLFIRQVLNPEHFGLEKVDDGIWAIYFGP